MLRKDLQGIATPDIIPTIRSIAIILECLFENYSTLIKSISSTQSSLVEYLKCFFTNDNMAPPDKLEKAHIVLLKRTMCDFINYVSMYKSYLETLDSLLNRAHKKHIIVPFETNEFIKVIKNSPLSDWSHLHKTSGSNKGKKIVTDSGLLVELRNSFTHDIVTFAYPAIKRGISYKDAVDNVMRDNPNIERKDIHNAALKIFDDFPKMTKYYVSNIDKGNGKIDYQPLMSVELYFDPNKLSERCHKAGKSFVRGGLIYVEEVLRCHFDEIEEPCRKILAMCENVTTSF